MTIRSPSLADVISTGIDSALENVHTALPGCVTKYDAAKCLVDVQPLLKAYHTDEFGERQVTSLPVVTNCPVQFPSGSGLSITFPLSPGDTGLLILAEGSLDKWLAGSGGEVDPEFDTRFSLTDGIFIPGVSPPGRAPKSQPGVIAIGKTDGDFVGAALAQKIAAIFNAHVHSPPIGGPPAAVCQMKVSGTPPASLPTDLDIDSKTVKVTP